MPPRLPAPVPPTQHEITTSYIRRLATLHGLDVNALWRQVTSRQAPRSTRRVVNPEQLAALTGRSPSELAGALPEIRQPQPQWAMFRHQPQSGCHRCDAKHPGGPVIRLLPHHRYVCTRHRTWIGPPDIDGPASDLSMLPAVVNAQYRHLRILHRHGWAATYDAVLTSFMICGHIWSSGVSSDNRGHVQHAWDARAEILIPQDTVRTSFSASRLFAAVYPEAVYLAAIIASPFWRKLASGTVSERLRFNTEISTRVTYPYSDRPESSDAIAHWADSDAWREPSAPLKTYSPGRASAALSPLHGGSVRRHENSALWFSRKRDAGSILLHHRNVLPVIRRAWTPNYERIAGAIWHSRGAFGGRGAEPAQAGEPASPASLTRH
ncbi:TniQ family protein [Streptomyces olivoreticuli]